MSAPVDQLIQVDLAVHDKIDMYSTVAVSKIVRLQRGKRGINCLQCHRLSSRLLSNMLPERRQSSEQHYRCMRGYMRVHEVQEGCKTGCPCKIQLQHQQILRFKQQISHTSIDAVQQL